MHHDFPQLPPLESCLEIQFWSFLRDSRHHGGNTSDLGRSTMEISKFRSRPSRSWDGYYYLLAYKRSRKLHLPMSGVDSVAKVVEPEVVAAPLLLGAPSPSRDVGIKDETWMARVVFPTFPGDLDVGCWMYCLYCLFCVDDH